MTPPAVAKRVGRQKLRIGRLLIANGLISDEQLETALQEQKKRGRKLGQMLVELGYLSEERLLEFLAEQLGIPFVDLRHYHFNPDVAQRLPETHARRFRAVILEDAGRDFVVGMVDPTDVFAADEVARILKRPIRQALVRESDLLATIDRLYRRTGEITNLAEELQEELAANDFDLGDLEVGEESTDAPVFRLLRSLFEDAVQVGASDIHIEPDEAALRVRQRVDGVLQEQRIQGGRIASALVLRLKLMSGLDISEKRLPQDGRFHLKVRGHGVDVRLSTMPVQHGESVVMRLLDQSAEALSLDDTGMPPEMVERIRGLIRIPHGLLLVTGPTGSGKTTTLYGALRELNSAEKKIITVEDPVEYRLPRVNQVQVNTKIDLTFARVLRAALRQDPDIVMVGEMRDQETAVIGLRAAMTGHLVLSTLHTNDAVSSALRLVDMGAPGYLAGAALRAIVAQRLVRRICESCRAPYELETGERVWLEARVGPDAGRLSFQHGPGCTQCNGTGYRGRLGVFELLQVDAAMADALRHDDPGAYAEAARRRQDFRPLTLSALDYAARGVTTLAEVLRVAEDREDRIGAPRRAPADGSAAASAGA